MESLGLAGRKRRRLTVACDRCRRQKIRCDDTTPKCSNCSKARAECVTKDLRNPNQPAERRHAQSSATVGRIPSELNVRSPPVSTPLTGSHSVTDNSNNDLGGRREVVGNLSADLLPLVPIFTSGNSLSVLTQWLDLAFARLGLPERFAWQYKASSRGIRSGFRTPDIDDLNSSVEVGDVRARFDRFLATINQVFPIVGPAEMIDSPSDAMNIQCKIFNRLMMTSSSDSAADQNLRTDWSPEIALSQMVSLLQAESLDSLRALILLALLLRAANESQVAWHVHASAVVVAQTLAIDKGQPQTDASSGHSPHPMLIWWSLYILDSMLSVELQRPPMIRECFHSHAIPRAVDHKHQHPECFVATVSLASIQRHISESLLQCSEAERSKQISIDAAITEKVRLSIELDQLLANWVEGLPYSLKPSEYPSDHPDALPSVSFLALQYYQALFLLHRNSLIINPSSMRATIETHFSLHPRRFRILNATSTCVNIARAIVNIVGHIFENDIQCALFSTYAPLIAVYILAIYMVKNPASESVNMDLEIQARAIRLIKRMNQRDQEQSTNMHQMLDTLHSRVARRVRSHQSATRVESNANPERANDPGSAARSSRQRQAHDADRYIQNNDPGNDGDELGGINVAASWFTDLHLLEGDWDVTDADITMFATTFDLPS